MKAKLLLMAAAAAMILATGCVSNKKYRTHNNA